MLDWKFFFLICMLLPKNLAKEDDDPCSQFETFFGYPLTECTPYKLDPTFYECYDLSAKNAIRDGELVGLLYYWCWNRLDNEETVLKNRIISTAYVDDVILFEQINQPFSSIVRHNGTHTICGSNENWTSPYHEAYFYCSTNTSVPVARFRRCYKNPEW